MNRRDLFKKALMLGAGAALARFGVDEVEKVQAAEPVIPMTTQTLKPATVSGNITANVGQTLTTTNGGIGSFTLSTGGWTSAPIAYSDAGEITMADTKGVKYANNIINAGSVSIGDTVIRSHADGGIEFIQNGKVVMKIHDADAGADKINHAESLKAFVQGKRNPDGSIMQITNSNGYVIEDITPSGTYRTYMSGEDIK